MFNHKGNSKQFSFMFLHIQSNFPLHKTMRLISKTPVKIPTAAHTVQPDVKQADKK